MTPAFSTDLLECVASWRSSARGLKQEIEQGVAIRQSLESKQARVDVLESNASQLERVLAEHGVKAP